LPPDAVFFTDRNLGANYFPAEMRKAGYCIVTHDEHFDLRQDVLDPEVIEECGRNGWLLITADRDMPRRWADDIRKAQIGVFCQTNNHQGPRIWIPRIVSCKDKLLRAVKNWDKPFIGFISAEKKPSIRHVKSF
jgi:hypothetical protein